MSPFRVASALVVVGLPAAAWFQSASLPTQLNLREPEAQQQVISSVTSGYPDFGRASKAFVAIPRSARGPVVEAAIAWMRGATRTAAVRKLYLDYRESAKPIAPDERETIEARMAREDAEQRKSIEDSRKTVASLPPDQRPAVLEALKQAEGMLNNPELRAMRRTMIESDRASERERYQENLKEWEENLPASLDQVIARRLHSFLDECGDVDFSVQLVTQNGRQRFASAEYETKSSQWKFCFRAGPEAVAAARQGAEAWLKELP